MVKYITTKKYYFHFVGGDFLALQSKETLIKRYESCAETYKKKGDREYAYAKNGLGDEHYGKAKEAYKRSKRNQDKADALKNA